MTVFKISSLCQDDPGSRWMFSDADTVPETLTVPSAIGNIKLSPFMGVSTSFALSLFVWVSDASIFSSFSMSSTNMSPFQIPTVCNAYPRNVPGRTLGPNWCNLDMSFAEIGWYSTIAPNGKTRPLNGTPNRLSYGVLPSDKRSCMFQR